MPHKNVPDEWWQYACEVISHPVACVGPDNKYVWANMAYERLVGYSLGELRDITWMEITKAGDVGGDLEGTRHILEGTQNAYTMSKVYRHKLGANIPVQISVWRFPPTVGEFMCFVAEAVPMDVGKLEYALARRRLKKEMDALQSRIGMIEREHKKVAGSNKNTNTTVITSSEDSNAHWIAIGFAALIAAVMYLIYVGGWSFHKGDAEPPKPPAIPPAIEAPGDEK